MFGPLKRSPFFLSRGGFYERIAKELEGIKEAGLYKEERIISTKQSSNVGVGVKTPAKMTNFCANNYLGLSDSPILMKAGREALVKYGVGMSSVRFICGTQTIHKRLEQKLTKFHGTEDTILYTSCFDANAGLFETLLGPEDAVISDSLNHASIIDGIRLCKAQRLRYKHDDMNDLEQILKGYQNKARTMLIATDGVFSMDGDLAQLSKICDLAERYGALLFVDDSHATGFIGPNGRGTPEHFGVADRVDIICSTLGKALGGSSGGYTTGNKVMIDLLRQRSRPYLFSNSLPPVIASFALKALEIVDDKPELREKLMRNADYFKSAMAANGYKLMGNSNHPICPVLVGDANIAVKMADYLQKNGIFVTAFSYPVVPHGMARIRVQLSASHSRSEIDKLVELFKLIGKQYNII
jgi:glycine C-acetyltransferase